MSMLRGLGVLILFTQLLPFPCFAATKILILGDSLSSPYQISAEESWTALASQEIRRQGMDAVVLNASFSGQTAAQGAVRIGGLLGRYRPDVVVVALGANDGLRRQPPDRIHASMRSIMEAVRATGARPLLVGMKLPPNTPAKYAQDFYAVFTKVAAETATPLVPFMLERIAGRPEYFLSDRLHPNAAAQPLLLETLWPELSRLLGMPSTP